MNGKNHYGRSETVVNVLPAFVDDAEGEPVDPSKYGKCEPVVHVLEPIECDLGTPTLVLTIRLPDGPVDAEAVGTDVYHLVGSIGDCEKALGGLGMNLVSKSFAGRTATLKLNPILVENATERLAEIVRLIDVVRTSPPVTHDKLTEATLDQIFSSPAERMRQTTTRHGWRLETHVAN